jgi:hypothetical protein
MEQIYQQMQLLFTSANDAQPLTTTFTKFFAKCLVQLDELSFNVDTRRPTANGAKQSAKRVNGGAVSASNDDQSSGDADEDDDEDEDGFEDEDDEDEDELDDMIANSKKKLQKNETTFGIPDGSDSEISDFEVNEDDEEEDDDEEEEGEEEEDEDDDEDEDEDEEESSDKNSKKKNKKKGSAADAFDDIDSDEVDEDLVDLYGEDELGDEKDVLELDKPSKSFAQVDFDRDDFGIIDDSQLENNKELSSQAVATKNKIAKANRDLFDQDNGDEDEENKGEKVNKSSFELRQEKVFFFNQIEYSDANFGLFQKILQFFV